MRLIKFTSYLRCSSCSFFIRSRLSCTCFCNIARSLSINAWRLAFFILSSSAHFFFCSARYFTYLSSPVLARCFCSSFLSSLDLCTQKHSRTRDRHFCYLWPFSLLLEPLLAIMLAEILLKHAFRVIIKAPPFTCHALYRG